MQKDRRNYLYVCVGGDDFTVTRSQLRCERWINVRIKNKLWIMIIYLFSCVYNKYVEVYDLKYRKHFCKGSAGKEIRNI